MVKRLDESFGDPAPVEVSCGLAQQIKILTYYHAVGETETHFLKQELPKFIKLESLILRDTYSIERFSIPPTLVSLSMLLETHGAPKISAIKEWIKSTSSPLLKYVQLPAVGRLDAIEVELSASRQIEWNFVYANQIALFDIWILHEFLSDLSKSFS